MLLRFADQLMVIKVYCREDILPAVFYLMGNSAIADGCGSQPAIFIIIDLDKLNSCGTENLKMWKLIVSDIDGTMVKDGAGSINPAYYEEINRLLDRGVRFMVCSGRQGASIVRLFQPVISRIAYACEGGSMICDGEKFLCAKTLPGDTVHAIVQDAWKIDGIDIMLSGIKQAYCKSEDSELYHWMVDSYGFDMEAVGDLLSVDDDIMKVSLYHKSHVEELTNPWFRPRWESRVKLTLAGIQWLDCVPESAGKRSAVTYMQEYYGIRPEETLVFGDNQNDMEMFEVAGRSYAVENARNEVKQAASAICEAQEKDGVLKVLKTIL